MDDGASTYHHGDQDISEQAATYRLFGTMTKWVSLGIATAVFVLVLWFCVGLSFIAGLIPGVILLGAGIYFLREKAPGGHGG
jgi:uncharacterized membrane protein